jgi:NAD dependent epimerase/dehydratase family enzyme
MQAPAFALRLLLGEMADGMLLASQRVVPARAEQLRFQVSDPRLDLGLQALFA